MYHLGLEISFFMEKLNINQEKISIVSKIKNKIDTFEQKICKCHSPNNNK